MPLGYQRIYLREDARRNPDWLYAFGDNVGRWGKKGQAWEMRNEPNAVGIATKYSPAEYFGNQPAEVLAQNRIIDEDMKPLFEHVKRGGVVIWPSGGIGTGYSRLLKYAPNTFEYIEQKLAALSRVAKLFDRGDPQTARQEAASHV